MARKLRGLPPYEIMRQTGTGGTGGTGESGGGGVSEQSREAKPKRASRLSKSKVPRHERPLRLMQNPGWWREPMAALREWWSVGVAAVEAPFRLEVSRVIVGASAAGVLFLVVLAFWLGRATGSDGGGAAVAVTEVQGPQPLSAREAVLALRDTVGPVRDAEVHDDSSSRLGDTLAGASESEEAPGGGSRVGLPDADPRVEGMNYLALVTTTPDEARRIQGFFAEYGVATFITKSNNAGLVRVIDVSRGFTRDEYRSGAEADHRSHRLTLGRAWKRFNKGIGDDLSSMAYSKYQGD